MNNAAEISAVDTAVPSQQTTDALRFLNTIHRSGYSAIFTCLNPGFAIRSEWQPATDAGRDALVLASQGKNSHYITVFQHAPAIADRSRCSKSATGCDALGLDLDLDNPTKRAKGHYYPTPEQAWSILEAIPFPILVVDSGYGLQTWFPLARHLDAVPGNVLHRQLQTYLRARVAALPTDAAELAEVNAQRGAKAPLMRREMDSTADLARVLRIPGSVNTKPNAEPKTVQVKRWNEGRADPDELSAWLAEHGAPPVAPPGPRTVRDLPPVQMTDLGWARVQNALQALSAHDYDQWLKVGMALHATGDDKTAFDLWNEWSESDAGYPGVEELQEKWDTFHRDGGGVTLGTLFHLAKEAGWKEAEAIYDLLEAALTALEEQGDADGAKRLISEQAQSWVLIHREKPIAYAGLLTRLMALTGLGKRVIEAEIKQGQDAEGEISAEQVAWLNRFVYLTKDNLFADLKTAVGHSQAAFTMLAEHAHPDQWPCPAHIAFARSQGKLLHHETYKPGQGRIVNATSDAGIVEPLLNIYNVPVLPEPKQDKKQEDMLIEHLMYLVDGNTKFVDYLLNFMATLIQFPGRRIHSAPLIIGTKGNGKSFVGDLMTAILGESNTGIVTTEGLAGAFQDSLASKQLCIVEEVKVLESQEGMMNKLKTWITNRRVQCNRKGRPAITIENVGNWMFFSNYDDAIRIDDEERRYAISISRALRKDDDYYKKLFEMFIPEFGGSVAGVLYLLKNRDLAQYNPYSPAIFTEARKEMIENTHSALDRQIATYRREVPDSREGYIVAKAVLASDLITYDEWENVVKAAMTYPLAPGDYGYSAPKPLSPYALSKAAQNAGLVKLGQKRVHGRKQMVYAAKNADHWRAQSESAIAEYIEGRGSRPGAPSPAQGENRAAMH